MRRKLLLGPPGCGKTTRILEEIEQRLSRGVDPSRIAYVSFTKAAIRVAKDRAVKRFNLDYDSFPYWRTVHSLCFSQLGLSKMDVFSRRDYTRLANLTGEPIVGHIDHTAPTIGNTGDAFLFYDQFARNTLQSLQRVWEKHGEGTNWYRLLRFHRAYAQLRSDTLQFDFTDMLEAFTERGGPVNVDTVFIDEAQDLSPLQWKVLRHAFKHVPEIYIAGDDDQAIYTWAGADGTALIRFQGEKEVLSKSRRLPPPVHALANKVVRQIKQRNPKEWSAADHTGSVVRLNRPDEAALADGKKWLMLARTRSQLQGLERVARQNGIYYTVCGAPSVDHDTVTAIRQHERDRKEGSCLPIWHDYMTQIPVAEREYMRACLRNGDQFHEPRVRIETIHSAKGEEADNVLMLTDYSERVAKGMEQDRDAELRVLYVGLTRAKQNLFLVNPMRYHYGYRV